MSKVLIIAEHAHGHLSPAIAHVLSAAKKLSEDIDVLVAGESCAEIATQAASLNGVKQVLLADHAAYAHALAENMAALIAELGKGYHYILAPANTFGKNILPRVSGLLDYPMLSDITEIHDAQTFSRPIYAGNAFVKVKVTAEHLLLGVRTTTFDAEGGQQSPAEIKKLDTVKNEGLSEFIKLQENKSDRPDLATAEVVISGGRGLQSKENFAMLERVADKLGAAVGASRAAVDAGFVPNDYQVGQTGKIVAPKLYIAVGISGAIQHLAGIKDSKVIVAINKDPEAPIFEIADYGLVADLFKVLPELEEKL